jgi:hypothetical protein
MMDPAQQLEGMTKRYNLSADQQSQLKPTLASRNYASKLRVRNYASNYASDGTGTFDEKLRVGKITRLTHKSQRDRMRDEIIPE